MTEFPALETIAAFLTARTQKETMPRNTPSTVLLAVNQIPKLAKSQIPHLALDAHSRRNIPGMQITEDFCITPDISRKDFFTLVAKYYHKKGYTTRELPTGLVAIRNPESINPELMFLTISNYGSLFFVTVNEPGYSLTTNSLN